ncbi:MAG: carboxypeptidase-like regulatory domain-containing protein, partial [Ignavibacteriae bacterium]|nr:carboxypeptidase-like regulatory domain-containing protein [Ignavibacteriota bacterium]
MVQKLLLSLFLFTFPLYGQSISVHGYVTDENSGETLIGVSITVESNRRIGTTTNKFGYFSLTVPNGNQQLIFSTIGYQKKIIPINSTGDMKLNIALEEDILNMDEVVITSSEEKERIAQPLTGVEQLRVSAINKL